MNNQTTIEESKHLLHYLSNDEIQIKRNIKSKFGENYGKYEKEMTFDSNITNFSGKKISIKIQNHEKPFNDLKLVIKVNDIETNTKICIGNLFKKIEFQYKNMSVESITGHFIEPMLQLYELVYTQINDIIVIPLPFDIISNNLCIVDACSKYFDKQLNIDFESKYYISDVKLFATLYEYYDDNLLKYHENTYFTPIKISKNYNYKYDLSTQKEYQLYFDNPLTDMIFFFVDENNNIIQDKLFETCSLLINNCNRIQQSYISLMHETNKKLENTKGYYYFPIENLFINDSSGKKNYKYTDLRFIDCSICFDDENYKNHNKNITLVICAIFYNISKNFTVDMEWTY